MYHPQAPSMYALLYMHLKIDIMLLQCEGQTIPLEDQYVHGSPLLKTMAETYIGIDTAHTPQGNAILLDSPITVCTLMEYLKYLRGMEFDMTDAVEEVFLYMGHDHRGDKCIDLWVAELQDAWHKDNFERLELWKDPYLGLIRMDLSRPCFPSNDDHLICTGIDAIKILSLEPEHRVSRYSSRLEDVIYSLISKPPNREYLCNRDTFIYDDNVCWRRIFRSPNEIAFLSPTSGGILAISGQSCVYLTRTAYYNLYEHSQELWESIEGSILSSVSVVYSSSIQDPYYYTYDSSDYEDGEHTLLAVRYPKEWIVTYMGDGTDPHVQRKEYIKF